MSAYGTLLTAPGHGASLGAGHSGVEKGNAVRVQGEALLSHKEGNDGHF